eukprot:8247557-Ditylum_brightwellii.AAC.1
MAVVPSAVIAAFSHWPGGTLETTDQELFSLVFLSVVLPPLVIPSSSLAIFSSTPPRCEHHRSLSPTWYCTSSCTSFMASGTMASGTMALMCGPFPITSIIAALLHLGPQLTSTPCCNYLDR